MTNMVPNGNVYELSMDFLKRKLGNENKCELLFSVILPSIHWLNPSKSLAKQSNNTSQHQQQQQTSIEDENESLTEETENNNNNNQNNNSNSKAFQKPHHEIISIFQYPTLRFFSFDEPIDSNVGTDLTIESLELEKVKLTGERNESIVRFRCFEISKFKELVASANPLSIELLSLKDLKKINPSLCFYTDSWLYLIPFTKSFISKLLLVKLIGAYASFCSQRKIKETKMQKMVRKFGQIEAPQMPGFSIINLTPVDSIRWLLDGVRITKTSEMLSRSVMVIDENEQNLNTKHNIFGSDNDSMETFSTLFEYMESDVNGLFDVLKPTKQSQVFDELLSETKKLISNSKFPPKPDLNAIEHWLLFLRRDNLCKTTKKENKKEEQ